MRRVSPAFVWWLVAGVAEVVVAVLLLANGYWYSIFGTLPLAGLCAYFAYREYERLRT